MCNNIIRILPLVKDTEASGAPSRATRCVTRTRFVNTCWDEGYRVKPEEKEYDYNGT